MTRPPWHIRRTTRVTTEALLRWDRAYQCLLHGQPQAVPLSPREASNQENRHENGSVCPCVYPTTGLHANY
jgi:hypothetical protein